MAIRQLRYEDDEILRKTCKEVTNFDKKLGILIDDMYDTMLKHDGVGLAAPQVGILKRVVVVDVGDGLVELVNPVLVSSSGEQDGDEGCLSVPGMFGEVVRPMHVTVKAKDRYGDEHEYEVSELAARAFCHEMDHLEGVLFIDKARNLEKKK